MVEKDEHSELTFTAQRLKYFIFLNTMGKSKTYSACKEDTIVVCKKGKAHWTSSIQQLFF